MLVCTDFAEAARLFADGFLTDPAFKSCLAGEKEPQAQLEQFFFSYLQSCKDLILYTTSKQREGYLCFYRWDRPPVEDFACPPSLLQLERYQILDRFYQRDFAVLDIMAVDPAHRGRGVAGGMIDYFVAYCKANRLTPLTEIFDGDHLALYQRRGFTVAHRQTRNGITTYVLEYPL